MILSRLGASINRSEFIYAYIFGRWNVITAARLAACWIIFLTSLGAPLLAAPNRPSSTPYSPAEISAFQRKLAEAGCYNGMIDGKVSALFRKAAAACPAVLTRVATAGEVPDRPDPAKMSVTELAAVQRQLAEAHCYDGPLDGRDSPALRKSLAACTDPWPSLRIETGMHAAKIGRVGVDAQCHLLATGSVDKTVRLWAMPEGRLIRTQRLPIGAGNSGKVYAVAVSPDGRLVAAGGYDAGVEAGKDIGIYLFDTATGTQMRRLGAFGNVILNVAFSQDGMRLAVALGGGDGIRVLELATGREIMADKAFGGKGSYGIAFGPDGSLYAGGDDGFLRRYSSNLRLTGRAATIGGKEPYTVAVDPVGRRLAVAYKDAIAIEFYDMSSLRQIGVADSGGVEFAYNALAWSRDGTQLYAGGGYDRVSSRSKIRRLTPEGLRIGADVTVTNNSIQSIAACVNDVVFGSHEPSLGLVRSDGNIIFSVQGHIINMREKRGDAFLASNDGKRIRFGLGNRGLQPMLFDMEKNTLTDESVLGADQTLAIPNIKGLRITGWEDTSTPRLNDRLLTLSEGEKSRALAVRSDQIGFVLGAEFTLKAYNEEGQKRWEIAVPGAVGGLNLARNGELVIAAYGDGTIRWHRWSDGKELLALFVNKDTKAWVAWTPSGYYTASPGGEDMIGWHVNRGWEQPADFFPASKFRDQYSRPDIVERVLDTLDEAEAVKQANAAAGRKAEAKPIAEILPPVVTILSPVTGSTVEGDSVRLDYLVRSPSGLPVDGIEALVDGRPLGGERGLGRPDETQTAVRDCLTSTRGLGRVGDGLSGCRGSLSLRLPPGTSEVGLFARTGGRAGDVVTVRLTRATGATGEELAKPRLFALVVGISAYERPDYALGYAAKDAADFAAALTNQQGGLYGEVTLRTLADGKATASAVRDGLDWLRHQVTSRDVGLIYLAGHGLLDDRDRFYFLAADSDAERLRATAVPREDIQDALDGLAGKALLFLDSCHSGAVATKRGKSLNINAVANEFASSERGVVAFTASTGRQVSQENAAWGNGAFTKAVIEALGTSGAKAKGDLLGTGQITTSALDLYVSNRVKGLTSGEQSPIMIRPPTVPDFALATAR